ncbi:MAG: hypothetical protein ACKO0Z_16660 [Betaproteobacteria bacterium]
MNKRIQQQQCFVTSDGTTFFTIDEAEAHQKRVDFVDDYENCKLRADNGTAINAEDVLDWLKENRDLVFSVLG